MAWQSLHSNPHVLTYIHGTKPFSMNGIGVEPVHSLWVKRELIDRCQQWDHAVFTGLPLATLSKFKQMFCLMTLNIIMHWLILNLLYDILWCSVSQLLWSKNVLSFIFVLFVLCSLPLPLMDVPLHCSLGYCWLHFICPHLRCNGYHRSLWWRY